MVIKFQNTINFYFLTKTLQNHFLSQFLTFYPQLICFLFTSCPIFYLFFPDYFCKTITKTLNSNNILFPYTILNDQPHHGLPFILNFTICSYLFGGFDSCYNNTMGKFSNWSKQEDHILKQMIAHTKSKKWIKTSLKLKQKQYLRTPSECRQRYINYLAPNIDKSQITQQELQTIYEKYEQLGPKWSLIQQHVRTKTQCKIKNVFYGNVKNLLKTTYKFFTLKTASFINTISTDYLQIIYDGCLEFDGVTQARSGIRAMDYRNNKIKLLQHIQTDKEGFLNLINIAMKEIFHQGPIKCEFNEAHAKRIRKMIHHENKAENQKINLRNANIVKHQEFSESEYSEEEEGSMQEEEYEMGKAKIEGDLVKMETGDAQIKVEHEEKNDNTLVKSEEQRQSISQFDYQRNGENSILPYMDHYSLMQGYYPFSYYYPPPLM